MTVTRMSGQHVRERMAHPVGDRTFTQTASAGADWSEGSVLAGLGLTVGSLFTGSNLVDTVGVTLALGRQLYGGDATGLVLMDEDSRPAAHEVSDHDATAVDQLQISLHEGPSVQAMARRQPVIVSDLRSDSRWRFWAPLAADLGFRSVLSVPLTDSDTLGALSVYSRATSRFHSADLVSITVFSQLASAAISVAREREQLIQAVESRTIVGQAQGILMNRAGIDAAQAFAVLRRYSSQLNVKLRTVAEGVIANGALPTAAPSTTLDQSASAVPFRPMTARSKQR